MKSLSRGLGISGRGEGPHANLRRKWRGLGAEVGPMIVNGLSHKIKTEKTVEVSGKIYLPEMKIDCGET